MREHFIDKWPLIETEAEIVELQEGHDNIRASTQKSRDNKDSRIVETRPFSQEAPRK